MVSLRYGICEFLEVEIYKCYYFVLGFGLHIIVLLNWFKHTMYFSSERTKVASTSKAILAPA